MAGAFLEFLVQWAFPITIVIILIIFSAREWFHSSHYYHNTNELHEMQTEVQILDLGLKTSLHILQQAAFMTTATTNTIMEAAQTAGETINASSSMPLSDIDYHTLIAHAGSCYESVVLSWDFVNELSLSLFIKFVCGLCICATQIFEIRMIHPVTASGRERNFNVYIRNSYPVTTVLLHCFLLIYSNLAYWGLITTRSYIVRCVDILILWYIVCAPLSRIIHNAVRLSMHYITFTQEEFLRRSKDVHWWVWLVTATSGIRDLYSFGVHVLTTVVWLYALYPFSYFTTHGWSNCSQAAWMYSGHGSSSSSSSYNRSAALEQLATACATSFVNMYMSHSNVTSSGTALYINSTEALSSSSSSTSSDNGSCFVGSNGFDSELNGLCENTSGLLNSNGNTAAAAAATTATAAVAVFPFSDIATSSQYTSTVEVFVCNMLIHAHILLIWYTSVRLLLYGTPPAVRTNKWLRILYNKQLQAVFLIGIAVNTLVCLLRICIFLLYTSCMSWWGWCVAWMFIHMHLGLPFSSLNLVMLLNEKTDFISEHKSEHVAAIRKQMKANRHAREAEEEKEKEGTKLGRVESAGYSGGSSSDAASFNTGNAVVDAFLSGSQIHSENNNLTASGTTDDDTINPVQQQQQQQQTTDVAGTSTVEVVGGLDMSSVVDIDADGNYILQSDIEAEEQELEDLASEVFHACLDRTIRESLFTFPTDNDDSHSEGHQQQQPLQQEEGGESVKDKDGSTIPNLLRKTLQTKFGVHMT